jgi:hypothetical protein
MDPNRVKGFGTILLLHLKDPSARRSAPKSGPARTVGEMVASGPGGAYHGRKGTQGRGAAEMRVLFARDVDTRPAFARWHTSHAAGAARNSRTTLLSVAP